MNATDIIDSYVSDVARRLPRKLRNDVGFELRALLNEDLTARAEEAGRPADEAMAYVLVRAFGAPDDVADRYRPQSFTIVKPSDTRNFALWALGGVALQWAVTLPAVMGGAEGDALQRFARWWLSAGLLALWWPGFMVVAAIIASWIKYRWPAGGTEWRARVVDRDHVNRPLMALGLAAAFTGASLMIFLPLVLAALGLPPAVRNVLAFDPGFIATRAPWLLLFWISQLALLSVVLAEGRWRRMTRRLDIAFGTAIGLLMVWFITAGPIWQAALTDKSAKGIMWLLVIFVAVDVVMKLRRELMAIGPPAMPAAHA